MNCFQPFARWWLVLLYHVSFDCHSHFKFGHRGQTEWSANKSGQTNWAWGKQKNSYLPLRSTVWWSIGSYIELYVMTLLSYLFIYLIISVFITMLLSSYTFLQLTNATASYWRNCYLFRMNANLHLTSSDDFHGRFPWPPRLTSWGEWPQSQL